MAQSVRLLAVWDVVMQAGNQARNPKSRDLRGGGFWSSLPRQPRLIGEPQVQWETPSQK